MNNLNQEQLYFLSQKSKRYIWWQSSKDTMKEPAILVAKIMNTGTLEDTQNLLKLFSIDYLIHILKTSIIGQFTYQSWVLWHCNLLQLTFNEIPTLPARFPNNEKI